MLFIEFSLRFFKLRLPSQAWNKNVCLCVHISDCSTELISLLFNEGKDTEALVVARSLPVVSEGRDKHPMSFLPLFPRWGFYSLEHKRPHDTQREAQQQARCLSVLWPPVGSCTAQLCQTHCSHSSTAQPEKSNSKHGVYPTTAGLLAGTDTSEVHCVCF